MPARPLPAAAVLCTVYISSLVLTAPGPAMAEDIFAVVELFTSQGCSSCPPADALLGELAGRPGVLALSNHVGYWDYLGWKDPLAGHATAERQRAYARAFALRYVYTPQIVINGAVQMPGSQRDGILSELGRTERPLPVPVAIHAEAGVLTAVIGVPEAPPAGAAADIWLFFLEARVQTMVPRGENAGRTLDNVNVVREVRHIGTWRSGRQNVTFAPPSRQGLSCAVVVQTTAGGAILGAASVDVCDE